MSFKGIIFIAFAILGAILNFSAKWISVKTKFSELSVKVASFVIVLISVILLFVFGK